MTEPETKPSERAIDTLTAMVAIVDGSSGNITKAVTIYEVVNSGIPADNIADRIAPMIADDYKTAAIFGAMWAVKAFEARQG